MVRPGQIVEGKDFTVTMWGHPSLAAPVPNYECKYCQYATIYPQKIQEHFDLARKGKHHHDWKYPKESPEIEKQQEIVY